MKISKADLVPTEANLLPAYDSFAELEAACAEFMDTVNHRVHRVTRRTPAEMLAEERPRLHRVPDEPHVVVFGLVSAYDLICRSVYDLTCRSAS